MKKKKASFYATVSIYIVLILQAKNLYAINFLAYGDIRGHFEPCGCDPATDLGGLKRLAYIIEKERSSYKNMITLDLGNNFSLNNNSSVENNFIKEGIDLLRPDISLVNEQEFKYPSKFISKRTYVLSNTKKKPAFFSKKNIKEYLITKNHIFFGYLSHKKDENYLGNIDFLISSLNKKFNKHSQKKILLFSGDLNELKKISNVSFFDLIVSSNSKPLDSKISFEEKRFPILLRRTNKPKNIYMVPWGGMGVLRGGDLQFSTTQSIGDLFLNKSLPKNLSVQTSSKNNLNDSEKNNFVTWLDLKYDIDSSLSSFFKNYHNSSEKEFEATIKKRLAHKDKSKYAGSQKCSTCHQSAFDKWKKSKHAKAFATLIHKKRDKNINCIKCHVLAWDNEGGFVSQKDTPQFLNVQCENCHGPRKDHTLNPTIKSTKANKETCVKCHNESHSPTFDFEIFWSKIHHK